MAFISGASNGTLQLVACFLSLLALGLEIYMAVSNKWTVNDIENTVLESVRRTSGLFYKCTITENDSKEACEDYDVFFVGLPAAVMGGRVLTVGSASMSFIALLLIAIGGSCTTLMAKETDEIRSGFAWSAGPTKPLVCIVGGVLMVISGCMICAATSWFAALIVEEYRASTLSGQMNGGNNIGTRPNFGPPIWVGFGTTLVCFVSGAMAIMGSSRKYDENNYEYTKPHNPYESAALNDARDDYV